MINIKVTMEKVTECTVDSNNLEQFVNTIQNGGMYVYITTFDRKPVDLNEELYDDEYLVTIFKTNELTTQQLCL